MKLLSDEELKKQVEDITQTMLIALSEWQAGVPTKYDVVKAQGRSDLFSLIKSQQQAWGEYVIGEDEREVEVVASYGQTRHLVSNETRNKLRAEQRTRNNKKERE